MNKEYWYMTYIVECPVCGSTNKYREGKYTDKPLDIEERFDYSQQYDHCGD